MNKNLGFNDKIGILDPQGLQLNPLNDTPYSDTYRELAKTWSTYPTHLKAKEILDSIQNNQLTICKAGTGTGKTVILPKLALHYTNYLGKVGVTLPKRVVTLSAATFAATTLDVELGKEVGYIYKGAPKEMTSGANKIVYMTDGSMIMKIVNDPELTEYKFIIIDEAHERKVQIDMLLLLLKKIMIKRPEFRVIIMSATIDSEKYQKYFGSEIKSNIVNVTGKTNFEITVNYLDYPIKTYIPEGIKIIEELRRKGTIQDLIFFITTSREAVDLCKIIRPKYSSVFCVEVYSDMDKTLQIFAEHRSKYLELGNYDQKLVMATNVAESSLTIDGLKVVIDSGYELFSHYDPDSMSQILEKRLISKAQALQRRGRVGRLEPGTCYHLLTKEQFDSLEEYPTPDILRQDLTIDILKIIQMTPSKSYADGLKMLGELMDPPLQKQIDVSYDLFKLYKLIDDTGAITSMGEDITKFSSLPINRTLFMLYAFQMHCAKEACAIVSMMEALGGKLSNLFFKSDTVCESGCQKNKASKEFMKTVTSKKSDHLTYLNIFETFQEQTEPKTWANKYGIRLEPLNKAAREAKMNFYKIVNASRAPQMDRVKNTDVKKRLKDALVRSHLHLTAQKLQPLYPTTKNEGQIAKDSVVHTTYSKRELHLKKFIYDEFASVEGSWSYNNITLL